MGVEHFDFFVIGAGSGGVRGARLAAQAGRKVGIAERSAFGGTCVNVGCVPKKLFSYASHFSEYFEQASGFGWHSGSERQFDMGTFIRNKDREILRLNGIYEKLLEDNGVRIFRGEASFIDSHRITIGETIITADKILIATGGTPIIPKIAGASHGFISDDLFYLDSLPKRVVIVGGGYIAVEFAGIFRGLGSQVTQIYRGKRLLGGFDEDVSNFLASEMVKKGIDIRFEDNITALRKEGVRKEGDLTIASLQSGVEISADIIFFAIGRRALSDNLNLSAAGVDLDEKGLIKIDRHYATSSSDIYAVGDIVGRMALTPVALREATIVVENLFGSSNSVIDYSLVPTAVFSNPAIGVVGLTQSQCDERGLKYDIYKSEFTALQHQLSGSDERVFIKMLVDKLSDKVLGIHMVGDSSPEIMQGFAVALQGGLTKKHFDATIGIHPTSAEELVTLRKSS